MISTASKTDIGSIPSRYRRNVRTANYTTSQHGVNVNVNNPSYKKESDQKMEEAEEEEEDSDLWEEEDEEEEW